MTIIPVNMNPPTMPRTAPAFIQLSKLSDPLEEVRRRLVNQLMQAQQANARQESFYEGSRFVRDLGIAIPPHLTDLEAVAAWPEIVVDVVDERMEWRGWFTDGEGDDDEFGLDQVYNENHLGIEIEQGTLDALICGPSFLTIGTGADGEPDMLVKVESPMHMTVTQDSRTRRIREGLLERFDPQGNKIGWKLYLPGLSVTTELRQGQLVVVDMDEHGRERVPIAAMLNRPRKDRPMGRSEITRAVRSLTESGMRTLLGMEISREFYAAPQRYLMGADESMFVDEEGKPTGQWAAVIGKMLMAPRDDEGQLPVPGVFQSASPQPFSDLLRTYSQMVSAATGVPAHHLGFTTDNPASEGAIRRADARLDKRAQKRQKHFNLGLIDAGELVVYWRDGVLPPPGRIKSHWEPVETPSPNAQADRADKMISRGVLDPTWDFTLKQYGLSDDEVAQVQRERRRSRGNQRLEEIRQRIAGAAAPTPAPSTVNDGTGDATGA